MDIEDDRNDRVKLMTIHTSKGLEFPYVFLCGFTEGVLPSAMSIKERRAKALEEERRLTYVAITRAEKAFYMTESEGFNFSTGLQKYPSRFLFEINEKHFVRKGKLSQEIIDEAKEQLRLSINRKLIQKKFEVGDIVNHAIWKQGKVIEVNEEKGEYQIKFKETGKTKPIIFEFEGLTKVELTEEEKIEKSKSEEDWSFFVENVFENNESQRTEVVKSTEKNVEEQKEITGKRVADLKEEKTEIEKVAFEKPELEQQITELEIEENRTTKINETEEKTHNLTTQRGNINNSSKPKEKNKLWSKLKDLWS